MSDRSPTPSAAEITALEPAADTVAGLDAAWIGLATAGSWFSGAERIELGREVRAARRCAMKVLRSAGY